MAPLVNVLVSSFYPFPTICLQLPGHLDAADTLSTVLSPICDPSSQAISLSSGRSIHSDASFTSLAGSDGDVHVRLAVRLPGGKGGFGSQLRAAGGRMNSKKGGQNNQDSCRDLNGRRLSTIKEAKKLAEYLQSEPEREAARLQASKDRLAKLNEEIARMDGQIASTSAVSASTSAATGPSSATEAESSTTATATPVAKQPQQVGRKRRLDDQKYVEESREMVDNVKNAVAAAMLKKRKMKASPPSEAPAAGSNTKVSELAPVVAASA